jgi:ketosteroid isomerase-like protein
MDKALQQLIDREAIRDLVLCYSRAIDRKDVGLLRDLYTEDATDTHGDSFDGSAEDFCKFIEGSLPHMTYSGHHACNHMISIEGDEGCGEVYALAFHVLPAADGGQVEDFMAVRYIDNYRRCADGKWRFSKRVVTYDMQLQRPFTGGGLMALGEKDPSYQVCTHRFFQRGARESVAEAVPAE